MYVYLFKNENTYKIGVSKNPHKRIKQLQTGNGNRIKLVSVFESKFPTKLEKILHNIYKINRTVGEWFLLDTSIEQKFITECSNIENSLITLQKLGNTFI